MFSALTRGAEPPLLFDPIFNLDTYGSGDIVLAQMVLVPQN